MYYSLWKTSLMYKTLLGLISHLLLTCNSAFNFFLYCAMSDQFRTELKKILGFKIQSTVYEEVFLIVWKGKIEKKSHVWNIFTILINKVAKTIFILQAWKYFHTRKYPLFGYFLAWEQVGSDVKCIFVNLKAYMKTFFDSATSFWEGTN